MATQFPAMESSTLISAAELTPTGATEPLAVRNFFFSNDEKKLLIYTNSKKVWRYDTRGDYWVLNLINKKLTKLGKGRPASSLMFAKFSPDGNKVAYVCEHNIYVEDLNTNAIKALTTDGNYFLINGTFDWAY
ncbi:DPP IV N-terminal domain-containing protein, partial [Streptomyces sp. UMAF16]|nr:DPP IV N-terminal domain-containing protein [Streptomyces sp. UMAF16]